MSDNKANYIRHTQNVSELVRYIGFGLLAAFYATRAEVSEAEQQTVAGIAHLIVGLSAVLAILFDYLHHTFAASTYRAADRRDRRAIVFGKKTTIFFFWAKQLTIAVGSIALTILILLPQFDF